VAAGSVEAVERGLDDAGVDYWRIGRVEAGVGVALAR
jgi:hypothetical protein